MCIRDSHSPRPFSHTFFTSLKKVLGTRLNKNNKVFLDTCKHFCTCCSYEWPKHLQESPPGWSVWSSNICYRQILLSLKKAHNKPYHLQTWKQRNITWEAKPERKSRFLMTVIDRIMIWALLLKAFISLEGTHLSPLTIRRSEWATFSPFSMSWWAPQHFDRMQ